jgi:hypothetical protein
VYPNTQTSLAEVACTLTVYTAVPGNATGVHALPSKCLMNGL